MIWIPAAQSATVSQTAEHVPDWLVDDFVESYVCWRETAAAANDAYAAWTAADHEDNALAFAAYRAALDAEEAAAGDHRDCVERIAGRPR
jgi:hypothetical protein